MTSVPPFLEAHPAADGHPLRPLIAPEFTTSQWRRLHDEGAPLAFVHALGVWAAEDVTVSGYGNHVFVEGERFSHVSVEPRYVTQLIEQGAIAPKVDTGLEVLEIDEPAVVFMGWGQDVYGHVLVETAPKIRIAARAIGQTPGDLNFLMPRDAPDWFRQAMALAGGRTFIEYDQASVRPLLRRAWVATLPVACALHPACAEIFSHMRPATSMVAGDAIFITRRRAKVTRPIVLLNADDIMRRAEDAGLRIVSPESLPVAEQAQLFVNARLIVGEYGSALMNAVFCRPDSIVGAIGERSQLLSAISAACRLRLSFLDPLSDPHHADGYAVDPEAFSRWLDVLLASSEKAAIPAHAVANRYVDSEAGACSSRGDNAR